MEDSSTSCRKNRVLTLEEDRRLCFALQSQAGPSVLDSLTYPWEMAGMSSVQAFSNKSTCLNISWVV